MTDVTYNTRDVLAASVAVQNFNGGYFKPFEYNSNSKHANSWLVKQMLKVPSNQIGGPEVRECAESIQVTDADYTAADEILDYFQAYALELVNAEKVSEFDRTMIEVAGQPSITHKNVGHVACMPKIHSVKMERDDRDDIDARLKRTSDFVGVQGQRCSITAKVEYSRYIPSMDLQLFVTSVDDKHIVKFFNQNRDFMTPGSTYNFTAYVKVQQVSDYSGAKETMVNRIKNLVEL